jgi:uncharacterized membrane protein YdjX (TVP38/TMEM64 family)
MLFLRITPLVPNWFLNISSGNLGVPLSVFVWGTFLGLVPNNLMFITMGMEFRNIESLGTFNPWNALVRSLQSGAEEVHLDFYV